MLNTRYPNYDVLGAHEEWDEHTRHVINQRLLPPGEPQFFTPAEAASLRAALARLLGDDDSWRIGKVLEQIDSTLAKGTGDGYRPEWQPPDQAFWRQGLTQLGDDFAHLPPDQQDLRLTNLQQQAKDFFRTLHKDAVSSYCSLPPVWSFMGYGGPAFPRGYVRIELGLRDPWEAKQDGQ